MSLLDIDAAILAAVATVSGLVTDSTEPDAVEKPAFYLLLSGFQSIPAGGYTTMQYQHTGRLTIPLKGSRRQAETLLKSYITPIHAAIEASESLQIASTGGAVDVSTGRTAYWTVSGVRCRICDLTINTAEKGPRGTL